jgi:hypothetical protein
MTTPRLSVACLSLGRIGAGIAQSVQRAGHRRGADAVGYELCAAAPGQRGLHIAAGLTCRMQTFGPEIQRYSRHIAIIPVFLGIALTILTGRTLWLEIGAVWFLVVIAVDTAAQTFVSVRRRLPPRRRRGALVEFLQTGGYSLAVASMAGYFALAFWSSYRASWLMG